MKIFGIGLSRTGTTSLATALELLGFRSVHFPHDPATRQEVVTFLTSGGDELRLSILDHCDALSDTPIAATFEALDRAYPDSRFILTVRERQSWLESCERWWRVLTEPVLRYPNHWLARYVTAIFPELYGSTQFERQRFARAYEAHQERVGKHFSGRDDLLVLDVTSGDGWPALCRFLGRPPPGTPFPCANRGPRSSQEGWVGLLGDHAARPGTGARPTT